MTAIVLQVQGAEPRCFLIEIGAHENPHYLIASVWALSAFDAIEQARRALPHEEHWTEPVRNGTIERVALCVGISDPPTGGLASSPDYHYVQVCSFNSCARKHHRLGVIK